MARAQQRDAAQAGKFYFRKDVGSRHQSAASSAASSDCGSGCDSPGAPASKEKRLRNCFPDPPLPENGANVLPIEEEYEEMTLNEIMNGKVCSRPQAASLASHPLYRVIISQASSD